MRRFSPTKTDQAWTGVCGGEEADLHGNRSHFQDHVFQHTPLSLCQLNRQFRDRLSAEAPGRGQGWNVPALVQKSRCAGR